MDEQRLNEIKKRAERINPDRYDANDTYHSQLDVPDLIAEVERLTAELDSTRQELRCAGHATATVYNKELAKLRKALEFYADNMTHTYNSVLRAVPIEIDGGHYARETLNENQR